MPDLPIVTVESCPKGYTKDLDKAVTPEETVRRVREVLASSGLDVLAETRRVDVGRLGIPVYLSVCGKDARGVMPTRKQMGKGSSPEQARASAVMELMERFAYFSFWQECPHMVKTTWRGAQRRFGKAMIPMDEILASVGDTIPPEAAADIMDTLEWEFYPATLLPSGRATWLPLDWFKLLNEFNGTSAGNTDAESLLQGLSELIERHVCCRTDRERPVLPTIREASCCIDSVLESLLSAFRREGVNIILKDLSMGMPLPTVGAVAWDPATFPDSSEIVFTAGTAATPAKAAIRAVTEVAQLAGDFCTHACYEASGLPKFTDLDAIGWLLDGPQTELCALPSVESSDIRDELFTAIRALAPLNVYTVRTTRADLRIPAHYTIAPGLSFRERDRHQSIGLFTGRKLVEECDLQQAEKGIAVIETAYPGAHFLPFFRGMLAMRGEDHDAAQTFFEKALPLQPDDDAGGLVTFYHGYIDTLRGRWKESIPMLEKAFTLCPEMKEYGNLLGVARFKTGDHARAAEAFRAVLKIDKGSAMDLANLGMCEAELGNGDDAARHLKAALELDVSLDFARERLKELEDQ